MCSVCYPNFPWQQYEDRAKKMSEGELRFAIKDCTETAEVARKNERAGYHVSKDEGFYHDERSVYSRELSRRGISFR